MDELRQLVAAEVRGMIAQGDRRPIEVLWAEGVSRLREVLQRLSRPD